MTEHVRYEQPSPAVALLRLNRPEKLNAFSVELESALLAAVERACADEGVRVVIFAGSGAGFSGGWDLGETDLVAAPELSARAGQHTWLRLIRTLRRPDKLFIAAVHGWVAGQGLELCVASDMIVAAADARFYFAEVRVGFNMTSGVAKVLPLLVGIGNAKRLALLGGKIDADEAYRLGLAVELAPSGEHEETALGLAAEALRGAPLAVAAQKRLFDTAIESSLAAVQDAEVTMSLRLTYTEDHQEAKRAFAEKRAPEFRGR